MTNKSKLIIAGIIVLLLFAGACGSYLIGKKDGSESATVTTKENSVKIAEETLSKALAEKAVSDKETAKRYKLSQDTISFLNDSIKKLNSRKFVTAQTVHNETKQEQVKQIDDFKDKDSEGTLIKILDAPIDSTEIVRLNKIVVKQAEIIKEDSTQRGNDSIVLYKCLAANKAEGELNKVLESKHKKWTNFVKAIEVPFIWVVTSVATLESTYLYLKNK